MKYHPEEEKRLKKASQEYIRNKPHSSYRKIAMKYAELAMNMFGYMVKKFELRKGNLLPCIFCDKGAVKKGKEQTFCGFCLGLGLIDKEHFRQFNQACKGEMN